MRTELTRAVLLPWFSDVLRNWTICFRMFLYLVTYYLRIKGSFIFGDILLENHGFVYIWWRITWESRVRLYLVTYYLRITGSFIFGDILLENHRFVYIWWHITWESWFRLYVVTYYLRITGSLLWRSKPLSKMHVPIYPYLISERIQNCFSLWPAQQRNQDSQATCYHIYKHAKLDGRISQKIWES